MKNKKSKQNRMRQVHSFKFNKAKLDMLMIGETKKKEKGEVELADGHMQLCMAEKGQGVFIRN